MSGTRTKHQNRFEKRDNVEDESNGFGGLVNAEYSINGGVTRVQEIAYDMVFFDYYIPI